MKMQAWLLGWMIACGLPAMAVTRYVNGANAAPTPPYTAWATAAQTIQAAVDVCAAGDEVVVSNGVYTVGARVTPGYGCSNRVVITKNILVRSVSGAVGTVIMGQGPVGSNAVRCVYMSAGALEGFTLSNGYTRLIGQGDWNYDRSGGGVNIYGGTAVVANCILSGNHADRGGGGGNYGTFSNCVFYGNTANSGGGAHYSTLYRCAVIGNTAEAGGGTWEGTADCCTFFSNRVTVSGGGSSQGSVYNSLYRWNRADSAGGGAGGGTLYNCTLADNWAGAGGGVDFCSVVNCIIWGNVANFGSNFFRLGAMFTCSAPLLPGAGCISNDPQFINVAMGDFRLQEGSPCIDAGTNLPWMAGATDLDGNPRVTAGRVDMGCYEFIPEPTAGLLLIGLIRQIGRIRQIS
jgi:hypothetical protein